MDSNFQWTNFFEDVFERIKNRFNGSYPLFDEEEAPPTLLALRDAIFSLPCAVKVLEVRVDTELASYQNSSKWAYFS